MFGQHGPEFMWRSSGQGRGLMIGQGHGPIGIPIGRKQFSGFGAILSPTDYLGVDQPYTFTFEKLGFFSSIFIFDSDTDIQRELQERLANFGTIISVERPLFSDRWIVVVNPSAQVTLSDWLSAFEVSWLDMGYEVGFIQAEGGVVSTRPGGTEEIIGDVGEAVARPLGEAAASAIKPLFPYVLGAIGIYAAIIMLPKLSTKGRG